MKNKIQYNGFGNVSECNYHLFEHKGIKFLVVEQLEETKTSITNCIVEIVEQVCEIENIKHDDVKIVEYYPSSLSSDYLYEMKCVEFSDEVKFIDIDNETAKIIRATC